MSVQVANGVVDLPVADEAEAVRVAKKYLAYFQGPIGRWECADQRLLRGIIPENRLRIYDVRAVIETLADTGSVLELRRHFGLGMVTALVRIEGRPLGVIANNPTHLAGAIDSDGADKAARFMQLCDAFDLPLLFLCDTPGIMVGPGDRKDRVGAPRRTDVRRRRQPQRAVLHYRTAQGLRIGRASDGRGELQDPDFHGPMADRRVRRDGAGGRGQARLSQGAGGGRRSAERKKLFEEMVARMYEQGKALNAASHFELDDVIDPVDSRRWIHDAGSARRRRPRRARQEAPARRFVVSAPGALVRFCDTPQRARRITGAGKRPKVAIGACTLKSSELFTASRHTRNRLSAVCWSPRAAG